MATLDDEIHIVWKTFRKTVKKISWGLRENSSSIFLKESFEGDVGKASGRSCEQIVWGGCLGKLLEAVSKSFWVAAGKLFSEML